MAMIGHAERLHMKMTTPLIYSGVIFDDADKALLHVALIGQYV